MIGSRALIPSLLAFGMMIATSAQANTIDIDFNSGVDIFGNAQGTELYFTGTGGFQVIFTDDNSNGSFGGDADGVHITNSNYGNIKVGSQTDFVLAAYNNFDGANNFHSSGVVATFNQGATLVSFDDTDDDGTLKSLFAFDQFGNLIAQSPMASQVPVIVNAPTIGPFAGSLIYRVEFDTAAGTAGGSTDGTYFTIDNFHAEGVDPQTQIDIDFPDVPEPATILMLGVGLAGLGAARRRNR